jgi:NADPH:quinone reductase
MRAVVVREFGPIGSSKVEDIPLPSLEPREVLIETELAPVNFVDTLVFEGKYQFLPDRPFVPGKGPVGTVSKVGHAVIRLRVGDRVLAMAEQGGYAEAVSADQEQCFVLPETMSFEHAACISLAYDTAWFALMERGRLQSGENVLVLGATGAVGTAAIQLARAKGAKVIAAVASPDKADVCFASGANHVIHLAGPDLRDRLRQEVHALTEGNGADVVIDPLGGDFFDAAIRTVAWRGRFVVIGFAAGRIPTLKTNYVLLKNMEVTGLQVSDYRKRAPQLVRACFADIFGLYLEGKIKLGQVSRFALADYASALNALLNRSVSGRAVLTPKS